MSVDTLKSNREYKRKTLRDSFVPFPNTNLNSKKTFCNLAGMLPLLLVCVCVCARARVHVCVRLNHTQQHSPPHFNMFT